MEITDVNTLFGAYPSQHPDSNPESLVAAMSSHQVDYCLALSTYGLYYNAKVGNDETLRACRTHDHLIPVATLNPATFLGHHRVIEAITSEPFEMFRFFPQEQGWPLDFAPFADVLSLLSTLPRMPTMVSVREPGDITTVARLAADYPHPLILEGVSGATIAEAISALRRNSHLYLETHALELPEGLTMLRDSVGIDRVLFGSNAPGMSLGSALRYVRKSALTAAEQESVLGGNAQTIWQGAEA